MRAVGGRGALLIGSAVAVVAMVGLVVAEALDVGLLVDPVESMGTGAAAAVVGVGLLVADIVAPVPSSVVMLAHGALFGVVPGAALSLLGRTGNAVVGVYLGRGAASVAGRRPSLSRPGGEDLVRRWGLAAVVVTRPVPVLAESTVVAAGATGLPAPAIVAAAAVGAVPEAVLYALAGDVAASYQNAGIVFAAALVLAAAAWAVATRAERRTARLG